MVVTTEAEILAIVREALGAEAVGVTIESTRNDFETWDSLGHLAILAALDEHFDGKVGDIKEIATTDSVRSILQILRSHGLM